MWVFPCKDYLFDRETIIIDRTDDGLVDGIVTEDSVALDSL